MTARVELSGRAAAIERLPAEAQRAEAARQFEALLVQHLLKTMREAAQPEKEKDGLSGGETYLELAEQQLALALADRGGLGIARMILRGLQNSASAADKTKDEAYSAGSAVRPGM